MPSIHMPTALRRAAFLSVFALVALAIACTGAPTGAEAQESKPNPGRMTVSGYGLASGVPDMAHIEVGVASEAETARAALDANSAAMHRVFATLKKLGVADKDMQTSNFSISPRHKSYPRGQTGPRVIEGYTVSNTLTVTVRKLDNLGGILDATVSDGANQFYGLQFDFAEPKPLLEKARRAAVADARAKAAVLADAAGVELGRIVSIHESGGAQPQPMRMARAAAVAEDVPIAAGESSLAASVSLTYEIN